MRGLGHVCRNRGVVSRVVEQAPGPQVVLNRRVVISITSTKWMVNIPSTYWTRFCCPHPCRGAGAGLARCKEKSPGSSRENNLPICPCFYPVTMRVVLASSVSECE